MQKDYKFANQLEGYNLTPSQYLDIVKHVAKQRGYNPKKLNLSYDNIHKLDYDGVKFGRVGYKDKIIYSWLEHIGDIPEGTTRTKYQNYRKRAVKVMKETNNKYSPSSLSYYLIW